MRRASGPNVSLFPFLTVLLCASGTLIVLLIALSQHVRETPPKPTVAETPAPAPPVAVVTETPEPEPLVAPAHALPPEPVRPTVPPGPPRVVRLPYKGPDPGEPLRHRLESARTAAAELTARLDAEALRRRDAEAKIEAARFAAAEATAALVSAGARLASLEEARDSGAAAAARATAEVAEFQTAVAAAAKEIDSPRALLPVVRTPDGVTADRPILVECIAAGARLRPYGVTVPVGAAGPAPTGVAPVVAGVQAASAATGESYVLLIVRPDGLPAFYQVAGALTAAGIRFGYELLDEDAEIAWGEATPETSGTVAVAVRDALQRLPAPRLSDGEIRFPGAGFPGASGPTGQGGGGSPPGAPGPGLPGSGPSDVAGAGRPGSSGGAPPSGAGGDPFAAGGTGAAAGGRPDLSKAFPSGSPADRLNVKGSVPALAAQPFTPPGGRFPSAAGDSGSVTPPGVAASGAGAPTPAPAGADGVAPGEGVAGLNAPPTGASPAGAGPAGANPGGAASPDPPADAAMQALAAPAVGAETADGGASGGSSSTAAGGASGSAGAAGASGGEGGEGGGGTAGGDAASGSTSRSFGERGRAPERDTRIRFNVRTPATLSATHLWINGRWTPLPADNDRLIAALQKEFDRRLADRGDPPTGFRWSPELRLSVRPDGRGQVERFIEAAERAGATVKLEGGTR